MKILKYFLLLLLALNSLAKELNANDHQAEFKMKSRGPANVSKKENLGSSTEPSTGSSGELNKMLESSFATLGNLNTKNAAQVSSDKPMYLAVSKTTGRLTSDSGAYIKPNPQPNSVLQDVKLRYNQKSKAVK